ncbi:MAG: ABC-F family ATP-binding cassette domain-containing protein [Actinomycetota bacterium]
MIVLDAQGLAASRPLRPLFSDLDLTVRRGDRVGVVGMNGCGKSTLLRILAGETAPDFGEVRYGRGARLGYLSQNPVLAPGSVRTAVGSSWQAAAMLDRLGMSSHLDASTDRLSGGQSKRVALAALLAGEWDLLVLDEPTNHLDLDAIGFLEDRLAAFTGGLVLVTHDRHVLDRITTKVVEIDRGRVHVHQPAGEHRTSGYAAYLEARAERIAREVDEERSHRNLVRQELVWLRRGAPARRSKPKARVDAARAVLAARSGAAGLRPDLALSDAAEHRTEIRRLGSKGIEMHGVGFTWPDGSLVLHPFEHSFEPGDRVGVVGPNGAGKSTLLDLLAGRLQPTVGRIEVGRTVHLGYYDQTSRDLDGSQRVREAVAGDKGQPSLADVELMRRFWFDGDTQFAPIATLSGGEKRRLHLLLTLLEQPNVLLLDEPTNDLDLDTLRALEDYLEDWPGIVVVVSHDRTFLDRTVTEVMAVDESGSVSMIRGGVEGWLAQRRASVPTSRVPVAPPSPRAASESVVFRSPSTLRRLLARAESVMSEAVAHRSRLETEIAAEVGRGVPDHQVLSRLSEQLATAQTDVESAELAWLDLAGEAESRGLDTDGNGRVS